MQTKQQFMNPGWISASLLVYNFLSYILLTLLGVNDHKTSVFKEK